MTTAGNSVSAAHGRDPGFWQHPALLAAVVLAAALPILVSTVPPLVDLPGHMARYRVELGLADSPALQSFYHFKWSLIGNLGVDLLVVPLAKLIGLEPAVKLIVIAIPMLTVAGLLWVAREVHGQIPPTAFFALPFAYNFAFIFGFLNFALSMALALLGFALWLRLGRLGRLRLRATIFAPFSMLLWLTHAFGWGVLGLLALSAELVRQHDKGRGLMASARPSIVQTFVLAPPIVLMLIWRSGDVAGRTSVWFNWQAKAQWLVMVLRDRWEIFDRISLIIVAFIIAAAAVTPRLGWSRHLTASAFVLAAVYLLLPSFVLGSAYADMRLAPYALAVAVIAIRLRPQASARFGAMVALAALAFFTLRIGGNTVSFWQSGRIHDRNLAALDHIPRGARLLSFVGKPCRSPWHMQRIDHLPGMAVVRKDAFSNDQWVMPGAQLISVDYPQGGSFVSDPSQLVVEERCTGPSPERWLALDEALATFPRNAFDYVWLIEPPRYDPALTGGMQPIWRNGSNALFRIVDRRQAPDKAARNAIALPERRP